MAHAQNLDSLNYVEKKQYILAGVELREWRQAFVQYQKSKIRWLSYRKKRVNSEINLEVYDYEWRTARMLEFQNRMKKDNIISDSLFILFQSKTKVLEAKFKSLAVIPFKQSFFNEMNQPVQDSMKIFRHQLYKNRYK